MEFTPSQISERGDISNDEEKVSDIANFFSGKSVFITGAAGFLGSVLLATLLQWCPGIRHIYILLREKKGVTPEARKEIIFQKKIFQPLKQDNSAVLEKVKVVEGDITLPDMGISREDIKQMKTDVAIVFHCAAAISFFKSIRYLMVQNVLGTKHVLDFSKSLPNLQAFVYTSSAYSNCNRKNEIIEEDIYRLAVPARKFLEAVQLNAGDDVLANLERMCTPAWPNAYTFTKALAEDLIADYASDIPLAIVRPSIILCAWKGIMPGYAEEGSGVVDIAIGIGKGFIRVLYCHEDKIIDSIPVDIVANSLIASAWAISKMQFSSPLVINCVSGTISPCTWGDYITSLYRFQKLYPMPKMYQIPFLVVRRYKIAYWVSALVNHYAPAVFIDLLLVLLKKKPRLTKLYRYYDKLLNYLGYFLTNEWHFCCDNFQKLGQSLNAKDAKQFSMDLKDYNIGSLIKFVNDGSYFYSWEFDKRQKKDRLLIAYKRSLITGSVKWTVIVLFWTLIIYVALVINL